MKTVYSIVYDNNFGQQLCNSLNLQHKIFIQISFTATPHAQKEEVSLQSQVCEGTQEGSERQKLYLEDNCRQEKCKILTTMNDKLFGMISLYNPI